MVEPAPKNLKALVFGGSGATGRELVDELLASPKWDKVTVVVRRTIDRWESLPEDKKKKLDILFCENFDQLNDLKKWDFTGYDTCFCALGSQSLKYGKKIFYQVDHDYTLQTAKIAKASKIPHYSLISSTGADHKSFYSYYMQVKGQTENEIIGLGLPLTSIFRPGMLLSRDNDKRVGEDLFSWIPGFIFPKIECRDVGRAMQKEAEIRHDPKLSEVIDEKLKLKRNGKKGAAHYFYENATMLKLARMNLFPSSL